MSPGSQPFSVVGPVCSRHLSRPVFSGPITTLNGTTPILRPLSSVSFVLHTADGAVNSCFASYDLDAVLAFSHILPYLRFTQHTIKQSRRTSSASGKTGWSRSSGLGMRPTTRSKTVSTLPRQNIKRERIFALSGRWRNFGWCTGYWRRDSGLDTRLSWVKFALLRTLGSYKQVEQRLWPLHIEHSTCSNRRLESADVPLSTSEARVRNMYLCATAFVA